MWRVEVRNDDADDKKNKNVTLQTVCNNHKAFVFLWIEEIKITVIKNKLQPDQGHTRGEFVLMVIRFLHHSLKLDNKKRTQGVKNLFLIFFLEKSPDIRNFVLNGKILKQATVSDEPTWY